MRILGVTETCDLGSLYMRLIGEGHEVKVTISEPLAQGTMAGLVPRAEDWRAELDWVRKAGHDGVIVFEAVGFGALQDELRGNGFNVIGGSAFGDRLENDRAFALGLLRGPQICSAPTVEFDNVPDALADLAKRPRRCVFKRCDTAGDTFVGTFADGQDVAAVIAGQRLEAGERFILMDHVEGVLEAAAAGCATIAKAPTKNPKYRICPNPVQRRPRRIHHQMPTFVPNCKNFELRAGKYERSRRPHQSAPSRPLEALRHAQSVQIAV